MADRFTTVDEYIDSCAEEVRGPLREIRRRVHDAVPGAAEKISYHIPAITLDGRDLVYFAAWRHHVSLYPAPEADEELDRELAGYRAAKGTLRFPLNRPIPYELIGRVAAVLAGQRAGR